MITNKLEIRIVALKRTGHHAIIEWMLDGITGKRVFINNSRPRKPVFNPDWIMRRPDYRLVTRGFDEYDLSMDLGEKFTQKDGIIYNYENWPLSIAFPDDLDTIRAAQVGQSETVFDVIICRDPLNNAASYFKRTSHKHTLHEFREWMDLWCDYADAAMVRKTPRGQPIVPIHYNLWLTNPEYRSNTARQIGIADRPLPQRTAKWGDGSSFAPGQIEENAIDANALKLRWMEVQEDPIFREMFQNTRAIETSRKYLDHIGDAEGMGRFDKFLVSLQT